MRRQYRAWSEQRGLVEEIAARFAMNGFNFKSVLKDWVLTNFYRADGIATSVADEARLAELDDIGLVRMLAPEQVERKITAVFGKEWGRLKPGDSRMDMLYGGIDSKEVTERATDPSGAMGSLMRTLSNDVSCKNTALDFSRPNEKRLFFRDIEPDVVPGSPEADAKIKQTIVHLHERVLGLTQQEDSPDVTRTYDLFAGIVEEAATQRRELEEAYNCRQGLERPVPDPKFAVRAWRAVMTYLLRRQEFLYE